MAPLLCLGKYYEESSRFELNKANNNSKVTTTARKVNVNTPLLHEDHYFQAQHKLEHYNLKQYEHL